MSVLYSRIFVDCEPRFYHYVHTPNFIEEKTMQSLSDCIVREEPDVCCLIEVEESHISSLARAPYVHSEFSNKYGPDSLLRKLPFFSRKGNGILTKIPRTIRQHFFEFGTKKLIYEIEFNDRTSLFAAHFSLDYNVRQRQFIEIRSLVEAKPNSILCGDFNIFHGIQELNPLLHNGRFKLMNSNEDQTFPAFQPRHVLDIFVCSPTIQIRQFSVLEDQFSDHRAVLLECAV